MSAEALAGDDVIDVAESLQEGDEVAVANSSYEYANPLAVETIDIVQWRGATGEDWRTARITLSSSRSTATIEAIDGEISRQIYNASVFGVRLFEPVVEEAASDPPVAETDGGMVAATPSASPQPSIGPTQTRCENCGAHVTPGYIRVFGREGGTVECCPKCPDLIRTHEGEIREARSHRGDRATGGHQ